MAKKKGLFRKKKQHGRPSHSAEQMATGILRLHPRGFGFLECDDSLRFPQDIFIPRHLTKNGVDGDRVEVLVAEELTSPRGPEGRVVSILERSRTHVAGTIIGLWGQEKAEAYVPLFGKERKVIILLEKGQAVEEGDRVILRIEEWGSAKEETIARLSQIIGNIRDPSCDIDATAREYEIQREFPSSVLEEVLRYGTRIGPKEIQNRKDLRSLVAVTIDPDTAKDFDDAISLTKTKKGEYELGVHIADVSHYVRPATALDEEAKRRCNSTYFPGKCFPMLPPALSDHLCSLKPNVNRLAVSVLMRFSSEADLISYEIVRSVIRSKKRFTYAEAKEVLDKKRTSPHEKLLTCLTELCEKFKKKRYQRGSIEFAMPELAIHCKDSGEPVCAEFIPYDITHQMVEECMLKTNEMIARHLSDQGLHLSYRVHEEPLEENLQEFAKTAQAFGFTVSPKPQVEELQKLFNRAFETPHGPHLATNYIRRMRLAIYSPDNIGHYGLSLPYYCHFTSPIRRYIDLVNHRILFGDVHELEHLNEISERCSEQERISARAEGSVVLLKKLRLLAAWHREDPNHCYEAIITKVKNFGIIFEIKEILLEGFIPIQQLEDDYYVLSSDGHSLLGTRKSYEYRIGNTIEVGLGTVDFVSLSSQWYIFSSAKEEGSSSLKRSRKKRKKEPKQKAEKGR